jgi:hypothetical protein
MAENTGIQRWETPKLESGHEMSLNPNTRVAVCCYAGDGPQVSGAVPLLVHHECPVVILSPTDSMFAIDHPGIENKCGGLRQYTGQLSLDRQREHMRILLEYPEDFFLMHDADSVCLSPKIPDYLYTKDVLWSNLVHDSMRERAQGFYMDGFPRLAFQPPYFLSRKTIERLLAPVAVENISMNPTLPFIDHYMVQLAVKAGVPWENFTDGFTGPISGDYPSFKRAWDAVQRGAVMIHSVKAPESWQALMTARSNYLAGRCTAAPPMPKLMHWTREQSDSRCRQMQEEAQIARTRAGLSPQQFSRQRFSHPLLALQRAAVYSSQQSRGLKA